MLCEVHGRPQLHLPKAKDARPWRGHHHRHLLLARLRVRGQVLQSHRGNHRLWRAHDHQEGGHRRSTRPQAIGRVFRASEGAKEVLIDLGTPEGKVVRIGTTLSSE